MMTMNHKTNYIRHCNTIFMYKNSKDLIYALTKQNMTTKILLFPYQLVAFTKAFIIDTYSNLFM